MKNVEPVIAECAMKFVKTYIETKEEEKNEEKKSQETPGKKLERKMKKFESTLNNTLDIMREHGLLAMVLWLMEKGKNRGCILGGVIDLCNKKEFGLSKFPSKIIDIKDVTQLNSFTESLESTLLARRLIEQMLLYAKHWARNYQALAETPQPKEATKE